jgi:DNA sulfur modification protein DndB
MMKQITPKSSLYLPALRAQMGDWIYYISSMRMADIARRISYAGEIHKNKKLNELLQRQVSNRKKFIVKYLETQEQRFFNSIIVGVYKGKPEWFELAIGKNKNFDPEDLPEYMKGVVGFLKLSGKEKLFAIDGQHRVAAIRDAVKKDKRFLDEEVSTIFVSAHMDDKGKKRTRRLFSTLNRYAKPVKRSYIIALSEDDTIAIVVRKLIDENEFFINGKIYIETKNLPKNDYENFSSLEALYDSMDVLLRNKKRTEWEKFKGIYPGESEVDKYYTEASLFWDALLKSFSFLTELRNTSDPKKIVKKYRGEHGGCILFRPIGLIIVVTAIKYAIDSGLKLKQVLNRIVAIPLNLTEEPWTKLLWDKTRKRMFPYIGKERQEVAAKLIFYIIHGDLKKLNLTEKALRSEYMKALNWDEEKDGYLKLPDKVD